MKLAIKYLIKSDKGLAVPLVLVIMLIFMILGTVIISVSTSQTLEAARQEERVKAHYIAYSGADTVATWIIGQFQIDPEAALVSLQGMIDAESSTETTLGSGTFVVEVNGTAGGAVNIVSTGTVGRSSRTVTLTLVPEFFGAASGFDLDTAVFSKTGIKLTGSSMIVGSSATNSIVANSVDFGWSTQVDGNFLVGPGGDYNEVIKVAGWGRTPYSNITGTIGTLSQERVYELPLFPEFPTNLATELYRNVTTSGGNPVEEGMGPIPDLQGNLQATIKIPAGGYYQETLSIKANTVLTIDLEESVRVLRLDNLSISQGHINLVNTGENGGLILYVRDSFTLLGSSTINNNGDVADVVLYYKGVSEPAIGGNTRLYGSIYIEKADFTIAGSNGILGHIVSGGQNISITGNAEANVRVLYAPKAKVSLGGSGRVIGPVVANEFEAIGNARVFYNPDEHSFDAEFPFPFEGNILESYRRGAWQ